MSKAKKSYRWAVVNKQGMVVRDVVSHRQAIYSDRSTASIRNSGFFTPMGLKVKRILVNA